MNSRTLIACAVLSAPALLGPDRAAAAPAHSRVVSEINEARAARGLPKLRSSRSLRVSARRVARELARRGRFVHPDTLRISRRFRARGETLALMRSTSARRVVRAWLGSPAHRRLILSPRLRWVGAAGAGGRFRPRAVWVAHLGGR